MHATPKCVGDITLPWLQEAIATEYPSVKLADISIDATVGDLGYLGSICRVRMEFAEPQDDIPPAIIIKLPSEDEEVLARGTQMGAYATEANFYRHLANQGVGRAPQFYFSVAADGTEEYMVAIEDLSSLRFVKQTDGASIDDCHTVMKALANMHGKYWQDEEIGKGWLGTIEDWGTAYGPMIETGLPLYRKNFGEFVNYQPFLDNFELGASVYQKVCSHLAHGTTTLMHGDSHIRNLAFDDDHSEPVRFYDWQLTCRGPGGYDVLYFMINSLPVEDQTQHFDELLDTYHSQLSSQVSGYSVDDLKRDMAYSSLTLFGFIAWLGNILPRNAATIELVQGTTPRYMNLMEHFNSIELLQEFV